MCKYIELTSTTVSAPIIVKPVTINIEHITCYSDQSKQDPKFGCSIELINGSSFLVTEDYLTVKRIVEAANQ
jgi:hypothetical protein